MSEHSVIVVKPARATGWIGIGLAAAAAALYGAYAGREGQNLAYLIGYCLPGTGAIWAAAWFWAVKPSKVLKGPVLFALVYSVALVTGLVAGQLVEQQAKTALAGIADARQEMRNGANGIDARPRAKEEAGRIEGFMRERIIEAANDAANYERDLHDNGLDLVFLPTNLAKPDALKRMRVSISQAEKVVARYKALSLVRPAQTRSRGSKP